MAAPAASFASDFNTKLENGRTVEDLRNLIGAGFGLRSDALSDSAKPQRIMPVLAEKLGLGMSEESVIGMVRFFMRGAIPFPMTTSNGSYVVFMNPVADTVLLTSWDTSNGMISLNRARFVTGETLEGGPHSALTARWTNTENMADTLLKITQDAQRLTSNPTSTETRRIEELLQSSQEKNILTVRRITAAGLGTSGKQIACIKKVSGVDRDTRSLSQAAGKTNISPQTVAEELLPTGGINLGELAVLTFASKEYPGNIVLAVVDQTKDCELLSVNGLKTIAY